MAAKPLHSTEKIFAAFFGSQTSSLHLRWKVKRAHSRQRMADEKFASASRNKFLTISASISSTWSMNRTRTLA
jgi:hypothetical protein